MAKVEHSTGLNTKGYEKGIRKLTTVTDHFGKQVKAIGPKIAAAFSLGAVIALTKATLGAGAALMTAAQQVRINVEALQILNITTKEAGVNSEILTRALRNINLRTQQARDGQQSYNDAFTKLNINVEKFVKLPLERRLEAVAKASAEATDQSEAYQAVSVLLGEEAGPKLNDFLQRLAKEGWDGLSEATKKTNTLMTTDTVKSLNDASAAIGRFNDNVIAVTGNTLAFFERLSEGVKTGNVKRELASIGALVAGLIPESIRSKRFDLGLALFGGGSLNEISRRMKDFEKSFSREDKGEEADEGGIRGSQRIAQAKKEIAAADQKLKNEAAAEKIAFSRMTTLEKILSTEDKIHKLRQEFLDNKDSVFRLQIVGQIQQKEDEVFKLRKSADSDTNKKVDSALNAFFEGVENQESPAIAGRRTADAITQIGGSLGGVSGAQDIQRQSLNRLQELLMSSRQIVTNTGAAARGAANIRNPDLVT